MAPGSAQETAPLSKDDIEACVFDAYGTLFDVRAAARRCSDALGDKAEPLAQIWRTKQLEYTWLRTLMGEYEDFWHVTAAGLDHAMEALELDDPLLRSRLLDLYMTLDTYPEVPGMLEALHEAGVKTAILSNGSPTMLMAAAKSAGIFGKLDDLISVDGLKVFKPHSSVYQLACDRLNVPKEGICFMSSNGWDASAAAHFGFRVVWVNRFGQTAERIPGEPERVINTLEDLPGLLGI